MAGLQPRAAKKTYFTLMAVIRKTRALLLLQKKDETCLDEGLVSVKGKKAPGKYLPKRNWLSVQRRGYVHTLSC